MDLQLSLLPSYSSLFCRKFFLSNLFWSWWILLICIPPNMFHFCSSVYDCLSNRVLLLLCLTTQMKASEQEMKTFSGTAPSQELENMTELLVFLWSSTYCHPLLSLAYLSHPPPLFSTSILIFPPFLLSFLPSKNTLHPSSCSLSANTNCLLYSLPLSSMDLWLWEELRSAGYLIHMGGSFKEGTGFVQERLLETLERFTWILQVLKRTFV